jgi:hypothetical protein
VSDDVEIDAGEPRAAELHLADADVPPDFAHQ